MDLRRHDSHYTRIGERTNRPYRRLFVEDNCLRRLTRNNFTPHTAFEVKRKPGVGLIIQQTLLGSFHITPRHGGSLLSYESRDLGEIFTEPDVRIRISVGSIIVSPLLRCHHVARPAGEVWRIEGQWLTTPSGRWDVRSPAPLGLAQAAGCIEAELTDLNVVFATEIIGNQKPGRVIVRGGHVMLVVADQFLQACGYAVTETPGEYRR